MKLEEVREIRADLFQRVAASIQAGPVAGAAQGAAAPASRVPFAAGFSVQSDGSIGLEVRVNEGNARATQEVIDLKGEVPELGISIESFAFPARAKKPTSTAAPNALLSSRAKKLHPGLSIGHKDVPAATLGAFVKCDDGRIGLLTAAHAVANVGDDSAELKGWIFQPGRPDVRVLSAIRRIGRVRNFSAISETMPNVVDAGLVEVRDEWLADCTNEIPKLDSPVDGVVISGNALNLAEIEALGHRPSVWKIGRQTGYTEGTLRAFDVGGIDVDYDGIECPFEGLIEIAWTSPNAPFSAPGDSGSILHSKNGNKPLGLHFAGFDDKQRSYACSLHEILVEFAVTLWDA